MINFRVITHLETLPVLARLYKLSVDFPEDGVLVLRERDAETEIYKQWRSLQALIGRARKAIKAEEADLGAACLERLPPGTAEPWYSIPVNAVSFRVPLVTNPLAIEYVRHETVHMAAGSLWWMNTREPRCSANWGSEPRYHLLFELITPEPPLASPV